MKLPTPALLAGIAALALIGSSASAAIIVDSSSGGVNFNASNVTPYTITSSSLGSFDPTGSGKLIVALISRQGLASNTTMTYGGVAMTLAGMAYNNTNNQGLAAIYYLDNPTAVGDLVLSGTAHNSISVDLYAVSGLAAGGPVLPISTDLSPSTDPSPGVTVSLTTGSAGFVVGAIGQSGTGGTVTQTSDYYDRFTARGAIASWIDNTGSNSYFLSDNQTGEAGVMVDFAAVPEPASLAMLGVGGLLIASRRRR
ncbi:MAG: PEP-CTERM sorting domain-containing protein [Phycisphaera sp.]|nr:PEP-CTERM sorting domain-containing protein [Phycisphaera sp.]